MKYLMSLLQIINKAIEKLEEVVCSAGVVIITLTIMYGVIGRYFLGTPKGWTVEVALFCYMYISFLGASLVHREDGHYKIGFIYKKLPTEANKVIDIVTNILILFVAVLLIYSTINVMPRQLGRRMTGYVDISKWHHTFSLTAGMSFIFLFELKKLIVNIRDIRRK